MPSRIEDYAIVGDTHTAALVARDGSIDWLCLPRFDSAACFAALVGTTDNGRWLLAPEGGVRRTRRRYREGTLILETEFETEDGLVAVIDFMPPRDERVDVLRIVEGRAGRVPMRMELILRFDYGWVVPWMRRVDGTLTGIAGPDSVTLHTDIETRGEDLKTVGDFVVSEGDRVPFALTWHPSHEPAPSVVDVEHALEQTEVWWRRWFASYSYNGEWSKAVRSSLAVMKAMTYAPTGGIVAAPTTSLPELIGGVRNWDYRFCWLRDSTFTLYAFMLTGFDEEARAWLQWLLRAVAGDPSELQIMYGPAGERRLTELELDWLLGYEGSRPVRSGNAAHRQLQLDVYGEVLDSMYQARLHRVHADAASWDLERKLTEFLEDAWRRVDEGIWEVRSERQHFTHSKVMAWVGFDRAVRSAERFGLQGPVERWRRLRQEVHDEVCEKGFDSERGSFVQYYGAKSLDASLLMIPLVGFLPATDERVRGTVDAIQKELCVEGFVRRYITGETVDGLPPGEGAFLPCTFWLVDNLALLGREREARELFEKLLALRNDVGLLSEEYDPDRKRLLGNFPQIFTHVSLVNSASNLSRAVESPAHSRAGEL